MKAISLKGLLSTILLILGAFSNSHIARASAVSLPPYTPHEYSALVITTSAPYSGYRDLYAEMARYGFNLTILETGTNMNSSGAIDFLKHPLTANLAQYDIIILQGSSSTAFCAVTNESS